MIVFDLQCASHGHVFEAWFGSTEDYESQRSRGLVQCPICGSEDVAKAVMAPRVSAKGNSRSDTPCPANSPVPVTSVPESAEAMKVMLRALAQAQSKALEGSHYVGSRFADEARAIHVGDAEERAIHGQATPEQARSLIDEGIQVASLPFPVRPPSQDN